MVTDKDYRIEYCPNCLATTSHRIEHGVGGISRMTCSVCGRKKEFWRTIPRESEGEGEPS